MFNALFTIPDLRSLPSFYHIFSAAELEIVTQDVQKDWPKELFPIRMYALKHLLFVVLHVLFFLHAGLL